MKKALFITVLFFISNVVEAQDCLDIGVNFHDVQYWSDTEDAFKNQMIQSGEFLAFYDFNWDNEVLDLVPRDLNGYPTDGIPYSVDVGDNLGVQNLNVRKMISSSGRLEQSDFIFLYDGNGSISFSGDMEVTSDSPGRIELTCVGPNNIYLVINESEVLPNHLRNFRLISVEDESTFESNKWNQDFLDRLAPFSSIRMMDWTQTNSCKVSDWVDRTPINYNCQNEKSGIAYEYIVELCNEQDKDLWICVPHMATPDYITEMANFFKTNLNEDIEIYLEYSNETWNWLFDQTSWIIDDFEWLDPSYPHNDLYDSSESQPYNSGLLAKRSFQLWRAVYGNDSLKINRVLGCQAGNPWVAKEKIRAIGNDGYDIISPAWYFGADNYTDFQLDVDGKAVVDSCRAEFYEIYWDNYIVHYALAEQYDKRVMCYEGGQHVTANGNEDFHALQAFYDAQTHPDMYELYDDVIDTLRVMGAELLMAYTLSGAYGSYGTWGHVSDISIDPNMDNSPKYMALIDNLPSVENCMTTSVIEDEANTSLLIYPNPSNGEIIIEGFSIDQNNIHFKLTDIHGRLISSLQPTKVNNSILLKFDESKVKPGMYFVLIHGDGLFETKKILIIK